MRIHGLGIVTAICERCAFIHSFLEILNPFCLFNNHLKSASISATFNIQICSLIIYWFHFHSVSSCCLLLCFYVCMFWCYENCQFRIVLSPDLCMFSIAPLVITYMLSEWIKNLKFDLGLHWKVLDINEPRHKRTCLWCDQQKHISASSSAQSDQRHYHQLSR